jgi:hypothetical protein
MAKKSYLALGEDAAINLPQPPRKLDHAGEALWQRVLSEFPIEDAASLETLCLAAQALDRAEAIAVTVEKDGLAYRTKSALQANPLLPAIWQKHGKAFMRSWRPDPVSRRLPWAYEQFGAP